MFFRHDFLSSCQKSYPTNHVFMSSCQKPVFLSKTRKRRKRMWRSFGERRIRFRVSFYAIKLCQLAYASASCLWNGVAVRGCCCSGSWILPKFCSYFWMLSLRAMRRRLACSGAITTRLRTCGCCSPGSMQVKSRIKSLEE